jgi:hypothetical protein
MREAGFKHQVYVVPDEWNEISPRNYLKLMKVFYSEYGNDRGLLMLFRALLGIPWWKFFQMRTPNLMSAAEDATAFLFEPNTLSKNLLPEYRGYAGPADHLSNVKMGEFCYAEYFLGGYNKTKEIHYLDKLVCTLYRPKKNRWKYDRKKNVDGDLRVPFNANTIGYYERKVAKWPMYAKQAILHFYDGAREEKIRSNPKVFDKNSGEESLYGLWSVMRSIARSGHMGDLDKVPEQYVDTVLMELNETVAEAERIEMERNKVTVER